ncbi:transketolase C-terminal domain-containing protein [Streptomyces sp. NPDC005562]|uniref:transketolase C-terminal domain-containing protein n=1 Tax=Streptomyces sp. NPDC005562 TaxID=3154890 RepID=UPI0033A63C36
MPSVRAGEPDHVLLILAPSHRGRRLVGRSSDPGSLVSAIRGDDPVVVFVVLTPAASSTDREYVDLAALGPLPLGVGNVVRPGSDATVVAVGQLVPEAVAVADELASDIIVEVFDPRTVYLFDWAGLAASVGRTGRLVIIDDTNRFCGFAAEVVSTAAEELTLTAPPRRVTRPDGTVLPFAPELDRAAQPHRDQLVAAVRGVCGVAGASG